MAMNNVKLNLLASYHAAGLERYNRREYEEALKLFDRVLGLEPSFAEAHYARALVFTALHRFNMALYDLEKAFALCPHLKDVAEKDGRLWVLRKNFWWRLKLSRLLKAG